MSQPPQRGDPQIPVDGATNQLVAKFSRLYAQAAPEDQLALRVWMRDIILGRKVGTANTVRARRAEKRMVEACERRILEFPLSMDAREVAKELKREGWYGPQIMKVLFSGSSACGQRRETEGMRMVYSDCIVRMPEIIPTRGTNDFDLAARSLRASLQQLRQSQEPPASEWKKNAPCAGSLRIIIYDCCGFLAGRLGGNKNAGCLSTSRQWAGAGPVFVDGQHFPSGRFHRRSTP